MRQTENITGSRIMLTTVTPEEKIFGVNIRYEPLPENHRKKFLLLLSEGLTYENVAREMGFSGVKETLKWKVRQQLKVLDKNLSILSPEEVNLLMLARSKVSLYRTNVRKKEELLSIVDRKARAILIHMNSIKIRNANLSQQAMAFGILFDKARLIANESTQNVAIKGSVDLSELNEAELKKRLSLMREEYSKN